jgi:hypothetical protein
MLCWVVPLSLGFSVVWVCLSESVVLCICCDERGFGGWRGGEEYGVRWVLIAVLIKESLQLTIRCLIGRCVRRTSRVRLFCYG